MPCPDSLRLQEYFDGESDPQGIVEIERHLVECASCRELLDGLQNARAALRRDLPRWQAPEALRLRIRDQLHRIDRDPAPAPETSRSRTWRVPAFWWGSASGAGASLGAAALAYLLYVAPLSGPTPEQLVDAHIRSVNSGHIIDVVSTDRHTVKPWLAAHSEVSPLVADFESQGYRLTGGRIDSVGAHRVAVAVYRHGAHVVDLYGWPASTGPLPPTVMRKGYHLVYWRAGGVEYCVVADTAAKDLAVLVGSLQQLASAEAVP